MADISTFPFVRHLRSAPTVHVIRYRKGDLEEDARGPTFWFLPLASAIAEVPVDDRELPFLFHARTADFQDVTAAGRDDLPGGRARGRSPSASTSASTSAPGADRSEPLDQLAGAPRPARAAVRPRLHGRRAAARLLAHGRRTPSAQRIAAGLGRRRPRRARASSRDRGARSPPSRRPPRSSRPSSADARGDPAGGRRGDVRAASPGRREGARDRRERAAEPDRARAPGAAAHRPARRQRAPARRGGAAAERMRTARGGRRREDRAEAEAEPAQAERRACGDPAAARDRRPAGARRRRSWPPASASRPARRDTRPAAPVLSRVAANGKEA